MAMTSRALAFASRWFDEATVRRTFEPLIADWQREWQEASPSERRRVSIRGLAAFLCAVIVSTPQIVRTAAPQTVTNRVAVRITSFVALISLPLFIPMLMRTPGSGAVMLLALVPSVIVTVFPFSMIGAVDAIRCHEPLPPHAERAVAAKLAIVALLFMIVFGGWVVPAGNQAWRAATSAQQPAERHVRELTTYQLIANPTLAAAHEPYTGGADRATRIRRELNSRAAVTLLPVLLIWLRWRALATGRRGWWSPLPAPLAAAVLLAVFFTTFFSGWILERELHASPGSGFWLPIVVLAIWGSTTPYLRRWSAKGMTRLLSDVPAESHRRA
jgi:hypothetical protein